MWRRECETTHQHCPKDRLVLLPRRVVDVGSSVVSCDPRLYISKEGEEGSYAALSYCWGGQQYFTTTVHTLDAMVQGIPVDFLPRTIFDVIKVARKLGIRFLWVDSLCIIQDSVDDKLQQISKMGEIFKNATITIAAANATRVTDGFLSDRIPFNACSISLYLNKHSTGTIYLAPPPDLYVPDDPLFSRGWAFQEFLLSPKFRVAWHCNTHEFKRLTPSYMKYTYATKSDFSSMVRMRDSISQSQVDRAAVWQNIIKE